ncbi:MAG: glycogen/starch synthase [Bacteroidales bacterium]|nr:glycogen/starch synthase [Bacteroidales bacterium]
MSEPKRVLIVSSEIFPYLPESDIATSGRYLPQGILERGREIRSFMPRYGCVNERRNQLHEVIRLSGMNIIINSVDRPLIIKVASISSARMQVYFIDNEDYFHRKAVDCDENGLFFADNDERAMFFAKGVLETVKKLRWKPDIVHCQGWISHFVPLYLKKIYREDPVFSDAKVVVALHDNLSNLEFAPDMMEKAVGGGIVQSDVAELATPNGINFAKMAIRHSDGVIKAGATLDSELASYVDGCGLPVLQGPPIAMDSSDYIVAYDEFYNQILG